MIEAFLIAVALCVDSLVVSTASSLSGGMTCRRGLLMAVVFGICQSAFPLLGALAGVGFKGAIERLDHWVAFGLLVLVGGKMIYDAFGEKEEGRMDASRFGVMWILGIATSIDAFAVGIGLGLEKSFREVLLIVGVTGGLTFLVTLLGVWLGKRGSKLGGKIPGILAGCVLIGLGVSILMEHTGAEDGGINVCGKEELQRGDLILVALPLDYDLTNEAASGTIAPGAEVNYIHVAIADVEDDGLYIIDATLAHGVDRHPIDTFLHDFTLKDGSLPRLDVVRLQDNGEAALWVEHAKKLCGRPYDCDFDPENEAQYCSELVRNSYISGKGDTLIAGGTLDFRTDRGEDILYWRQLFEWIKSPIPQGNPGVMPRDIARQPGGVKVMEGWEPRGKMADEWN